MANRRQFLKRSAQAAAAMGIAPAAVPYRPPGSSEPPPAQGRGGDAFPNVLVQSHGGDRFRLYEELLRDRVVGVSFFTIAGHANFPATTHLRRIADALGSRLGRDVFLYSITTDPEHDTVARLRRFAAEQGVGDGWLLLRPHAADDAATVSRRLFKHAAHAVAHPVRMVHYGHGGLNVWGSFGVDSEPRFAAERFGWLLQAERPAAEKPRRAGPRRLAEGGTDPGHNREAEREA